MQKYSRTIVVAISDIHSGNSLGLCNPDTKLQTDTGEIKNIELNEPQKHLWEVYTKALDEVKKLSGVDEIIVIHDGDVTHGNVHPDENLSTRDADQIFIAVENLAPWLSLKNCTKMRLAKGTGSHSFGEGTSDILVSKILQEKTKKDIKSLYHGLCEITKNKLSIDYAHHGPPQSKRNWLRGNEARYYLRSLMMDELQSGNIPPRIVLRGHYHSFIKESLWMDTYLGMVESTLCVIPPMCMLGDYGRQATSSAYKITNGVVAFELINNKLLDTYFFGETIDIRTKEEL